MLNPIIFDLDKLKEKTDGFSYYILGRSYDLEENGADKDYKKALHYYKKGIEVNYPLCIYSLGISYVLGLGNEIEVDEEKGQALLKQEYPKIMEMIKFKETPMVEKIYAEFVIGHITILD